MIIIYVNNGYLYTINWQVHFRKYSKSITYLFKLPLTSKIRKKTLENIVKCR